VLLDTHFLIWAALGSDRLGQFPWLDAHRPWLISPVSLLEIQFLAEVGRLSVESEFFELVRRDVRFAVDEPGLDTLITASLPLSWTRDPFDRLLCAHSLVRRTPLCSVDRTVLDNHTIMPRELRQHRPRE
jgi:PIN domain nuclease of toxin-antitoxin system